MVTYSYEIRYTLHVRPDKIETVVFDDIKDAYSFRREHKHWLKSIEMITHTHVTRDVFSLEQLLAKR